MSLKMKKLFTLIIVVKASYSLATNPTKLYKYNVVTDRGLLVSNNISNWTYIDLSKDIKPIEPGYVINLNSIAYGNNKIVVVGTYGLTASTRDEITWKTVYIAQSNTYPLNSIVFYNGKFYTSSSNSIYSSTDGETWTAEVSANYLNKLTVVNNSLYALGSNKILKLSNFGWLTVYENSAPMIYDLRTMAYGNGTYVVNSTDGRATLTSDDGIHWNNTTSNFGAGPEGQTSIYIDKFIVLKYLDKLHNSHYGSISKDGFTWIFNKMTVNNGQGNYGWVWFVDYDNSLYLAGGGDNSPTVLLSSDGMNWYTANLPEIQGSIYSLGIAITK